MEEEEKRWLVSKAGDGLTFCLECLAQSGEMLACGGRFHSGSVTQEDQMFIHYSYHTSAHLPFISFLFAFRRLYLHYASSRVTDTYI